MAFSISIATAVVAGMANVLATCFVPLLPLYLGYLGASSSQAARWRTTGLFLGGFIAAFMVLGLAAGSVSQLLIKAGRPLEIVAGVILLVVSLPLLGVPVFQPGSGRNQVREWMLNSSAPFAGVAVGLAWTPCLGPTLGAILVVAGQSGSATRGALLLGSYAVGIAIPFVLLTLLLGLGRPWKPSPKVSLALTRLAGVGIATIALLLLTGGFPAITRFLMERMPHTLG